MQVLAFAGLILVVPLSHAQGTMSPEPAVILEPQLRWWAQAHYPAITSAKQLPDGVLLAFLVDASGAVQEHTAGFANPPPVSVPAELHRLFPGYSETELEANHGAACFGGLRTGEPKYCVVFARVAKKP